MNRSSSDRNRQENSALLALAELRELEFGRVAGEERRRGEEAQARHLAAMEAERRAREEAEQAARAQHESTMRAQAEAEARAREEQTRLYEAEMRARLEHEGRLQREQARLEAQMRVTERAASPRWPYVAVPLLVATVAIIGTLAWRSAGDADRLATIAEQDRLRQADQLAAITAKLDALEDEQDRLERERAALVEKVNAASTDAERAGLQAQQDELDRKLEDNAKARGSKPTPKPASKKPPKPSTSTNEPATKPSRPPIVIDDSEDPLSGLGKS